MEFLTRLILAASILVIPACGDSDEQFNNVCDPKNANEDYDGDQVKNKDDLTPGQGKTCKRSSQTSLSLAAVEGVKQTWIDSLDEPRFIQKLEVQASPLVSDAVVIWKFHAPDVCEAGYPDCHIVWIHDQ